VSTGVLSRVVKPPARDADHIPRLGTSGAIPLLHLHVVTAWNGGALPLPHTAAEDIQRDRGDPVQERTARPDKKTAATLKPGLESLSTLRLWPSPLSFYPHPLKRFPQPHLLRLLLASAPWLITARVI